MKIQNKICTLSNIGLLEIWTQRMSLGIKLKLDYKETLCKSVSGEKQKVFDTSWVSDADIKKEIENDIYLDRDLISKVKWKIPSKEVQIFSYED